MAVSDAIREFDVDLRLKVFQPRLQKLERSARRFERLADGLNEVDVTKMPDVLAESVTALRQGHLPDRRVTKLVCMGGLDTIAEVKDGQSLVSLFLTEVKNQVSTALTNALLIGYFRHNFKYDWLTDRLRKLLLENKNRLPRRWKLRVDTYGLLESKPGMTLANLILHNQVAPPTQILNDSGLKGIVGQGGFGLRIFKIVCEEVGQRRAEEVLGRFWDYVGEEPIRFKNHLALYAKALLGPYVDSNTDEVTKSDITHFLLDSFSDPRTRPGQWESVAEQHVDVLKRWLTEQSFELLMQIVKRSNDTVQWKERVEFWQPYIDAGLVKEAWVGLGSRAESVARSMVREGLLKSRSSYGHFKRGGGSVDPMHSVIFMKIGDVTVSEWTHAGKMRLYTDLNQRAPLLYRSEYEVYKIRNDGFCDEYVIHHSGWQSAAEGLIKRYTGISRPSKTRRTVRAVAGKQVFGSEGCASCGKQFTHAELDGNGVCLSCRGFKVRNR